MSKREKQEQQKINTCKQNIPKFEYESKRCDNVKLAAELPTVEIYLYIGYIIALFAMGAYSIYKYSLGLEFDENNNAALQPGWKFIPRLKDNGDFEWDVWIQTYKSLLGMSCVHSITSLVVSHVAYKYLHHAWLVVGVFSVLYILGWKSVVFVLALSASLFGASCFGYVIVTLLVGLSWLALFNYDDSRWMMELVPKNKDTEVVFGLLFFSSAFLLLRLISFAIEKTKRTIGSSELSDDVTFTVFDALVYTFYLPNFFLGPVFIYKDFKSQITKPKKDWTRDEIFDIAQKAFRCIFWMLVCDILLHFLYIHSILQYRHLLGQVPILALGGMVMYISSFYQTKYVVTYGFPGCFMMIDRIVPVPNPRCIVRVVYFSEYWRYFDPGLHQFFKHYIYFPLGGTRHGLARQLFATFLTFTFVSHWHGGHAFVIMWSMCNCVAVFVEIFSRKIAAIPAVESFEMKYLGPAMTRRVHAMANVPLFIFSIHAILIFYSDMNNGWVFFDRLILKASPLSLAMTCFMLYSMTVYSDEVDRNEKMKITKVKKE